MKQAKNTTEQLDAEPASPGIITAFVVGVIVGFFLTTWGIGLVIG